MSVTRACGRTPHSPAQIANLRTKHAYFVRPSEAIATVVQPVARIRDQLNTPSCVGQATAAAVHALTGFDGSAISLWTDARRRDGNLGHPDYGTTAETAVESLIKRGLDPYEIEEESRSTAELSEMPDLDDELEAEDRRVSPLVQRSIIVGDVAEQKRCIVAALQAGEAVLWATGVKDPFFSLRVDEVVTLTHIGADNNGHEMRIVGYDATTDRFLVQNSWGEGWGGCDFEGVNYPGCFLVKANDLISAAWDTLVFELKAA